MEGSHGLDSALWLCDQMFGVRDCSVGVKMVLSLLRLLISGNFGFADYNVGMGECKVEGGCVLSVKLMQVDLRFMNFSFGGLFIWLAFGRFVWFLLGS